MKTLLLMRHAKSDWDASYGTDHDRPLGDRGVRSARLIGRVLTEAGAQPDLVISSTALRARSTAEHVVEAGRWDATIRLDPNLHGTGPDAALVVASGAPDVRRLMMIGHQPTWSMLVTALTGGSVDMKTATVAVIEFPVESWAEMRENGEIVSVYQPRDYFGTALDEISPDDR